MWQQVPTEEYERRLKRFKKDYRRETVAALANLLDYYQTLGAGVRPLQIKRGYIHPEGVGVVAIDQKGGGKALAQVRLYVYPDVDRETLHLLTIGDKKSQAADIAFCKTFVENLREVNTEQEHVNDSNRDKDSNDGEGESGDTEDTGTPLQQHD